MNNVAACVCGFVVGSIINLGLVTIGMSVFPLPEGVDFSTMDAVRAQMKLLGPEHFVFPLLGHSLGTLTGAMIVAFAARSNASRLAFRLGVIFLVGGILMIWNCGGPLWFIVTDLVLAYLPMAILGAAIAGRVRSRSNGANSGTSTNR